METSGIATRCRQGDTKPEGSQVPNKSTPKRASQTRSHLTSIWVMEDFCRWTTVGWLLDGPWSSHCSLCSKSHLDIREAILHRVSQLQKCSGGAEKFVQDLDKRHGMTWDMSGVYPTKHGDFTKDNNGDFTNNHWGLSNKSVDLLSLGMQIKNGGCQRTLGYGEGKHYVCFTLRGHLSLLLTMIIASIVLHGSPDEQSGSWSSKNRAWVEPTKLGSH